MRNIGSNRAISISIMLSLTRSVDECHIKKDFLYFLNYLWKCSVNAKCRVDDELGAGGIPGYVTTTIEQIILVHLIRLILKIEPIFRINIPQRNTFRTPVPSTLKSI